MAHPKTVALPNKDYVPGIVHDESLRNLVYPLDWAGLVEYVGLPEAQLNLAHAVVHLAAAPKSNRVTVALAAT